MNLAILTKLAHVITVIIMIFDPIELFLRDTCISSHMSVAYDDDDDDDSGNERE